MAPAPPPVANCSEQLSKLAIVTQEIRASLAESAKADADRAAGMTKLIESQRVVNESVRVLCEQIDLRLEKTSQNVLVGVNATQQVAELTTAVSGATAQVAKNVTAAEERQQAAIGSVAASIPAAIPWWHIALGGLGIAGPVSLSAVSVAWMLAKRTAPKIIERVIERRTGAAATAPQTIAPQTIAPQLSGPVTPQVQSPQAHNTQNASQQAEFVEVAKTDTQPRYVRVEQFDYLGEGYKEAVNREVEIQGDHFRPIAVRIHSTATQLAHGKQCAKQT